MFGLHNSAVSSAALNKTFQFFIVIYGSTKRRHNVEFEKREKLFLNYFTKPLKDISGLWPSNV